MFLRRKACRYSITRQAFFFGKKILLKKNSYSRNKMFIDILGIRTNLYCKCKKCILKKKNSKIYELKSKFSEKKNLPAIYKNAPSPFHEKASSQA